MFRVATRQNYLLQKLHRKTSLLSPYLARRSFTWIKHKTQPLSYVCFASAVSIWMTVSQLDFQNRERVASKVHRQETLDGLKKFNARRKLKVSSVLHRKKEFQ